ncbi:cobalt-precorrin-5B (C(1))-methyltransferase [Neokomagataea thailandica]|uniref:Cobalt-precorrin-5B C(1)-methyltransferase n=1 Tax=Neokomagataea tanensis NBRC 106556 TaxID=1223519 RepID=A0ABQ0QI23_9PROT|nr:MULTISPECIES: cobalt-precorrin-5B (C(1))-methyltransferase [Neokomagataea]GBR45600.1 cobalamin biosynthesis protein cobalt-precorrin-6A biosynthesis protein CbiD [Neokomagataea tanensis NBRC 106556]
MITPSPQLRKGWTTGSCATAAAKAAWAALCHGHFPDPVTITLPNGRQTAFSLAQQTINTHSATASVVKDAGDDPDVTHGALIQVHVKRLPPGSGLVFKAGPGVGTITRPGLPLPIGEPAINPVPRQMIHTALHEISHSVDAEITISIENGEELAKKTLNARLGIIGGLSILGTTGVVIPFSCAAWIDSIRRGIDVARALNLPHIAASTGHTSEKAVQAHYNLPDTALIDMGDFAGGVLKYLRTHPVPRLTIAGGVAKMAKLGQGRLDLHSKRGLTDMPALAELAKQHGASNTLTQAISTAESVAQAMLLAEEEQFALGDSIAKSAYETARSVLDDERKQNTPIKIDIIVFNRLGYKCGTSYKSL